MRQSKMPRIVMSERRLIARGSTAVALALIVWVVCALQIPTSPTIKPTSGVIWNYANASSPTYFDLPAHRDELDEAFPDPEDRAPVYLMEPCGTWNGLGYDQQQVLINIREDYGANACGQCHCNDVADRYQGSYWCRDVVGNLVFINYWRSYPDNLKIRWR